MTQTKNEQESQFENVINILQSTIKGKRSEEQIDILYQQLKTIKIFNDLKGNENIIRQVLQKLYLEYFEKNSIVFRFGDYGDKFFIILQGAVGVLIPNNMEKAVKIVENMKNQTQSPSKPKTTLSTRSSNIFQFENLGKIQKQISQAYDIRDSLKYKEVVVLKSGFSFGEQAIIQANYRSATIKCKDNCIFGVLDKESYQLGIQDKESQKFKQLQEFLYSLKIFQGLDSKNSFSFTYCIKQMNLSKDQVIFKEQQKADHFYLVYKGKLQVLFNSEKQEIQASNSTRSSLQATVLSRKGIFYF